MPKVISIQQKREWLGEYESGKSIDAIAKANNRDTRTVNKALEDARRDWDARSARAELMRDALKKHQDLLQEGLNRTVKGLETPGNDFAPLSWHEGKDSVFTRTANIKELTGVTGISLKKGRPSSSTITIDELLRQHFRNDKVWKLLLQWERDYLSHMSDRLALQRKCVFLLKQKTGYPVVDRRPDSPPFLYSYTTGPIIYEGVLESALKTGNKYDLERDIVADTPSGEVKHRSSVLAEAPGHEEECREYIIDAYRGLLDSPESTQAKKSYVTLIESAVKARQAVEEVTLLGYIPGQCSVCKRLGM